MEGDNFDEQEDADLQLPDNSFAQGLMTKYRKNIAPSIAKRQFNYRKFEGQLAENFSVDDKCSFILRWCQAMLKIWGSKLAPLVKNEAANSPEDKVKIGSFRQCRRHIKPLFELLAKHEVNVEILDELYFIANYCMLGDFQRAYEKYLELAIGNAPWPMGVTMVGIHERSGRTRIFTSQVAHILNDETQRKYLQSIKRLFSVAQTEAGDKSVNVA